MEKLLASIKGLEGDVKAAVADKVPRCSLSCKVARHPPVVTSTN